MACGEDVEVTGFVLRFQVSGVRCQVSAQALVAGGFRFNRTKKL
jgi:hypothetical protein